jgi:hypothetical protein
MSDLPSTCRPQNKKPRNIDRAPRQTDRICHRHFGGRWCLFSVYDPSFGFPETNFPRIVIGVDNGVMPIDQMFVTVTKPIEEAVNSVQGLERVWSITSRGSAEIDLFFSWKVDMFQDARTGECSP